MKTALMISFLFMGQTVNIDLALKPIEHITGMMYRKEWTPENQGMLFLNDKPRPVSFWMKNTYLELSIMYLDSDYNILEVYRGEPLSEKLIPSKASNVQYILEINPAMEESVRLNWAEFRASMLDELSKKEADITRHIRPS